VLNGRTTSSPKWCGLAVLGKKPNTVRSLTPEVLHEKYGARLPNACNSEHLLADAKATRKTVFNVSDSILIFSIGSKGTPFKNLNTTLTSQDGSRFLTGGFLINTPLINLHTLGCCPTGYPCTNS